MGPGRSGPALVGRGDELCRLDALVSDGARLVTLLGPPGVGKTRLARAFLERVRESPVWCELAGHGSPEAFVAELAAALGVPGSGEAELLEAMAARRPTVLVLDNFEQLAETCARLVAQLHDAAPRVVFVVTSRVRLRLSAERALSLEPLVEPEGTRLFEAVARATGWDEARAADDVGEIVRRLEGLPLAIVLAASRARALGVAAVREALEVSVEAVGRAPADMPPHHASLRHAIEGSLGLLDEGDAALLGRLTCFAGAFELADVAAVAGAGAADRIERLADGSLVQVEHDAVGTAYRLHAVIREIVQERLADGERAALRDRHARHFAARAAVLAEDMSTEALLRIARMERDLERAHAVAAADRESVEGACAIACALGRLVDRHGPRGPLVELLVRTAEEAAAHGAGPAVRARLACALGYARFELGDLRAAEGSFDEAIALAREAGASGGARSEARESEARRAAPAREIARTEAIALAQLATVALREGRGEAARGLADEAEARAQASGDAWTEGLVVGVRGLLAFHADDRAGARALFGRARAIHRGTGDRLLEAMALGLLGNFAQDEGAVDEAREAYAEAVDAFVALGTRASEGIFRGYLATVHDELGETAAARAQYAESIALLAESRTRRFEALFRGALGGLAARGGDLRAARAELDVGDELAAMAGAPATRATLALHRGQLDLALARAARDPGEQDLHLAHACTKLAVQDVELERSSDDVRFARRMLERAVRDTLGDPASNDPDAWLVDWEAATLASGEAAIDLRTRKPLRAIMWALVLARLRSPGETVPAEALITAGWPGERMRPEAGAHRLRVALSTLRKMGLRDALETRGDAYLLSTECRWALRPPVL